MKNETLDFTDVRPSLSSTFTDRLAERIRERPVHSVVQAALAGYAFQFFPLRSALNTALRLAVPSLFAFGLMKLTEKMPISEPDQPR